MQRERVPQLEPLANPVFRRSQHCSNMEWLNRKDLNGVGADGVGVKFPSELQLFPLAEENERKVKKHEKDEEKRKNANKKRRRVKKI